jgi:hypothetical protein
MRDEFVIGRRCHGAEIQQTRVEAELAQEACFLRCLLRVAANAADAEERRFPRPFQAAIDFIQNLGNRLEDRLEEGEAAIADGKLSRVHAGGETARTGGRVVANQGALALFVEVSVLIEGEGHCWNYEPAIKSRLKRCIH